MTTESVVQRLEDELFGAILPRMHARAARAEELAGAKPGSLTAQVQVQHELLAAVPVWGPRTMLSWCAWQIHYWA